MDTQQLNYSLSALLSSFFSC